jgi:hypothetical protein
VLRLMREHGLLAPSRVGAPRGPRTHDGTIIPETVDTMWGTDLTTTWLIERYGFRPPSAVRQDQLSTAALAA